jgi:hypothetical protein
VVHHTNDCHISIRVHCLHQSLPATTFPRSHPDFEPMDPKAKQSKRRDDVLFSLNMVIEGLDLAEKLTSITPAKAVFGTVGTILTMIRVSFFLPCEDPLRADTIHTGLDG